MNFVEETARKIWPIRCVHARLGGSRRATPIPFLLIAVFAFCSCRNTPPLTKRFFDPWHAEKARILSVKLPLLDPERNAVLVSAPTFIIGVADVLQSFTYREDQGAFERMEKMSAGELERLVRDRAMMLTEWRLLVIAADEAKVPDESSVQVTPMSGTGLGSVRYRTELERESAKIRRYWDRLKPGIPVTIDEMRRAYDKRVYATVQYIYLKTVVPEAEKTVLRQRFKTVLARARGGDDFATLVSRFSWDDDHLPEYRLVVDFYPGLNEKSFDDAAFGLSVGAISDIVDVANGILILKVLGRKGEWRPFDQLRDQLAGAVREEKLPVFMRTHLDMLIRETKLKILK
jgi:hypothetical protein